MKDIDKIPGQILEFISKKSYDELSVKEMELVNDFLTKEEFSSLHSSDTFLRDHFHAEKEITHSEKSEEFLLNKFRKKHKTPVILKLIKLPVPVWQIAAGLALLISFNYYRTTGSKSVAEPIIVTLVDTVYLAVHDTVEVLKRDTLIIEKETDKPASKSFEKAEPLPGHKSGKENSDAIPVILHDLNILSLEKKEEVETKGRNLKEETVSEHFRFVTL